MRRATAEIAAKDETDVEIVGWQGDGAKWGKIEIEGLWTDRGEQCGRECGKGSGSYGLRGGVKSLPLWVGSRRW